jgi:TPR repeat protein
MCYHRIKNEIAKTYYIKAEEQFNKVTLDDLFACIENLKQAESTIGTTNSKILYLKIDAMYRISPSYFLSDLDENLTQFFKITKANNYPQEKFSHMVERSQSIKKLKEDPDYSINLVKGFKNTPKGESSLAYVYYRWKMYEKAEYWAKSAFGKNEKKDSVIVLCLIAIEYYRVRNFSKAIELYTPGADNGYVTSMVGLGDVYSREYTGEGFTRNQFYDCEKAFDWYMKAVDLGDSSAMQEIGTLYLNNYGCQKKAANRRERDKLMIEWLTKAADLGEKEAVKKLISVYTYGLRTVDKTQMKQIGGH